MRAGVALVGCVLLVAGCGVEQKSTTPTPSAPTSADDTGIDAHESSEPVTRLVLVDPDTGATVVYDASEESESPLGAFGPTRGVSGDGRFAYLRGENALTVVDAGSWTFDHGDHSHFYVEPAAVAGRVDGRAVDARGGRELTTVQREDDTVQVLDGTSLARQSISAADGFNELRDVAAAAPIGDSVVAVSGNGAVIEVGPEVGPGVSAETRELGRCPGVTGAVAMGREVVFGCADGAVRILKKAGRVAAEPMPLPAGAPHPGPLVYRYGSTTLAGTAADTVWVLDARRGTWKSVDVADVVAANTVSGDSVLALTADGRLRAFDTADGRQTAAVELFGGRLPEDQPAPVIEVDADRAYVNDIAGRAVYEIDYRDGLRVARTFETSIPPGFMVEAGR
ncbi:PQQ-binding-like beta-propeller repeat protein [Mycolicibacterium smegmatis]|uniref:ABC transporter n=2 Tax=Mycolicibacterium smegmatis TaxID=1772 RepID=I7FTY2_MYCS2|nr:hypothetical protein [Mycolicibacterium smegmatis]AFP42323.1 putative ABC transporter [Mycolicibacterium smegmatis MC2 155]AIU11048.1 ABC transporter [Mycolicibacterium smegmatis MC2 155]AIU17672.1 ABC transporter [Mycolicibacterium smegmatis]AIU24296.1 ABC transporter [Mycolicibacterium smegmatis]MCC3336398.1 ABC transporter [Mycolicibacterium smegmatis]